MKIERSSLRVFQVRFFPPYNDLGSGKTSLFKAILSDSEPSIPYLKGELGIKIVEEVGHSHVGVLLLKQKNEIKSVIVVDGNHVVRIQTL